MDQSNSNKTPLEIKINHGELSRKIEGDKPCQSAMGCLMYAMLCTRPDLSFCVTLLSRYQTKNNSLVWQMIKRVLRYIKGTIDLKLVFKKSCDSEKEIITGYADASFGDDEIIRRSTSGFLFKLFTNSITWNSKTQRCVALSSMEAEYMAASEAAREALWLRNLLKDMRRP